LGVSATRPRRQFQHLLDFDARASAPPGRRTLLRRASATARAHPLREDGSHDHLWPHALPFLPCCRALQVSSMTPREHKALVRQFEQLDPAAAMYVSERIERHMKASAHWSSDVVIFCLESVRLSDPILFKIKTWIDEANAVCMPRKTAEAATYVMKVCGRCGASDNLKTCDRCGLMRYCGRECQVADWKQHKKTCRPCAETFYFSAGPSGKETSHVLLPHGQHKGPAKVVPADQAAILAKYSSDYTSDEVANIFKNMCENGYSSKEARAFIEESASNGAKVVM
jgi:hypothetical protein